MSIGEAIRDAIEQSESIGLGPALVLRRCPANWTNWCLKAHSDAIGTSLQAVAGPYTGTLTHPAAATRLGLASTSANDDNGGTGALTVRVTGLDANYDVASETVTLDGQTKVLTVATFTAVHSVTVLTAGSGGANAGTIYVADDGDTFTAGVPTAPFFVLEAEWNVSTPSIYTVPDGYSVAMSEIDISGDNGKTVTVLFEVYNGTNLWERRLELHVGSGNGRFTLSEPLLTARERLRFRSKVNTGTGSVMVQLHGILIAE